jgi:hypothetical protein
MRIAMKQHWYAPKEFPKWHEMPQRKISKIKKFRTLIGSICIPPPFQQKSHIGFVYRSVFIHISLFNAPVFFRMSTSRSTSILQSHHLITARLFHYRKLGLHANEWWSKLPLWTMKPQFTGIVIMFMYAYCNQGYRIGHICMQCF